MTWIAELAHLHQAVHVLWHFYFWFTTSSLELFEMFSSAFAFYLEHVTIFLMKLSVNLGDEHIHDCIQLNFISLSVLSLFVKTWKWCAIVWIGATSKYVNVINLDRSQCIINKYARVSY